MNPRDSRRPATAHVYHGSLPLWVLVLVAPLGLLLLASLTIALILGGVAAAVVLPLLLRRSARRRDDDLIELDPSDYHVVERSDRR
jgi:hypothetical protein